MQRVNRPIAQHLTGTLVLRSVQDGRDADRFAAFNAAVNGDDQGATCAALLQHHPTAAWDGFLLVEDEATGEVVSTTCRIPWRCRLAGATLDVAMLEMVVTHPDYRRQGLVRTQIAAFHQAVAAQGYDLSIVEGIPYYYRQFGYAYAGDHWALDSLLAAWIPASPHPPSIRLRRAVETDIPALMHFYAQTQESLAVHTQRDEAYWRYLLHGAGYPVYMVDPAADQASCGYVCGWQSRSDPQALMLVESSIPDAGMALATLQALKPTAQEIRLGWPASSTLVQVGRSLGAVPRSGDQWLVRITDLPRLLEKLAPVFAQRLAQSAWAGLTSDLVLNLFRQAYRLRFVDGALAGVDALGFVDTSMGADGGDLCIPPDAFVRLLLGYRSLDDLRDAWPDIVVRADRRYLLAALFPKFESYLWLPYMHCGHLAPLV